MNDSFPRRLTGTALATILLTTASLAADVALPGLPKAYELRPQQEAAEAAFTEGDHEKALGLFKDVLTPAGDKYAQYMVGHMTLNGLGTEADAVLATAWFAVAAERGEDAYVSVYDEVRAQLDADARRLSGELASDLLRTYGDCAIVSKALDERQAPPDNRAALSDDEPPPGFGPSRYDRRGPADPRDANREVRRMQDYLDTNCS